MIMQSHLSLLDVCKLPDVQIHSKAALFKSIVNKQPVEMGKIRDNIVKLSYTTKTIGVKNDQIGVFSKRIPLKFKDHLDQPTSKPTQLPPSDQTAYIPHKSFYTTPLMTVKKNKQTESADVQTELTTQNDTLKITSANDYLPEHYKPTSGLKPRTQSMTRIKTHQQVPQRSISLKNMNKTSKDKKSYSSLLQQLNNNKSRKKVEMIIPLFNEENVLFKRISKISGIKRLLSQKQAYSPANLPYRKM